MKKQKGILAILLFLGGCGEKEPLFFPPPPPSSAFILTTDYQSPGGFTVIDPSNLSILIQREGIFSSDLEQAVYEKGLVYVLNRFGGDNLQVIDPGRNWDTIFQKSTGPRSNPYDVEFYRNFLYITRYGKTSILILDEDKNYDLYGEIDLQNFADSDGIPEMAYAFITGKTLFVALQRFVEMGFPWRVTENGSIILAISLKENGEPADIKEISLPHNNPFKDFVPLPNTSKILIPCPGELGNVQDGGVVEIDVETLKARSLVSEQTLGGDIYEITVDSDGRYLFAITGSADCGTWGEDCEMFVTKYDISNGEQSLLYSISGFNLADIEMDGKNLWVARRSYEKPGIEIINVDSGNVIKEIPTNLPPVKILFMR